MRFGFNEAFVRAEEVEKLDRIAEVMERSWQHPGEVFMIEGHTDAVGSDACNLKLSRERAAAVKKALTTYYVIPPENLQGRGLWRALPQDPDRRSRTGEPPRLGEPRHRRWSANWTNNPPFHLQVRLGRRYKAARFISSHKGIFMAKERTLLDHQAGRDAAQSDRRHQRQDRGRGPAHHRPEARQVEEGGRRDLLQGPSSGPSTRTW